MSNPISDLNQFSPRMTITQLLKFCERKEIAVTKPMIQNYIRSGLLPHPADKRFYTHKHIVTIVLIAKLKLVFDIPAIHQILQNFIDGDGVDYAVYQQIMEQCDVLLAKFDAIKHDVVHDGKLGTLSHMMFLSESKKGLHI